VAGLAAVVAAMMLYYRRAGANAILALLLHGVLLIAALSCVGAVLTLPGIAGVVLTIGMAVDSMFLSLSAFVKNYERASPLRWHWRLGSPRPSARLWILT
jgi:SecD/SecF fusion protein